MKVRVAIGLAVAFGGGETPPPFPSLPEARVVWWCKRDRAGCFLGGQPSVGVRLLTRAKCTRDRGRE